ncbi:hypothetical protein SprV_0301214200 [Sparganum proliferum]
MAELHMEMHGFSKLSLLALSTTSTPRACPLSQVEIKLTKRADDIAPLWKQTVSPSSQSQPKLSTPHVQSAHSARPNAPVTCWCHATFGVKARRFTYPFSLTSKPVASSIPSPSPPSRANAYKGSARRTICRLQDFAGALFGKSVSSKIDLIGVVLNPSKCIFGVPSLEFLGQLVNFNGIHPLPPKVANIRDFSPPSSKRQLQRFLGMVNYHHRSLLHCAHIILPLTSLLSGPKGRSRICTTAYHPAANWMIERFHRHLNAFLSAADDPENRTDHLPVVLFGISPSLESNLGCSAAELVLSTTIRLPGQMISPTPREHLVPGLTWRKTWRHALTSISKVIESLTHGTIIRRSLSRFSRGTNFLIQRGTREEVVSVNLFSAAVPDNPLDESCGPLPPASPS